MNATVRLDKIGTLVIVFMVVVILALMVFIHQNTIRPFASGDDFTKPHGTYVLKHNLITSPLIAQGDDFTFTAAGDDFT